MKKPTKHRAAVEADERKRHVEQADALEVNEGNLVEAISMQPALCHDWHLALAEAKAEADRLKGLWELEEARLFAKVRENPSAFGITAGGKEPGVEKIKYAVIAEDKYQAAMREYHAAHEEASKIQAMVSAVEHKKKSLELLTSLIMVGFAAAGGVKVPRSVKSQADLEERRRMAREMEDD